MKILFSPKAESQLDSIDKGLRKLFFKHAEKVSELPPKRHLRFGLPFYVEEVTKQARMVYNFEKNIYIILFCFATHKEYERWYKSFK
jgi:mRNA-degrading endonuclease RelE of RelBE toxin-antitoxin system